MHAISSHRSNLNSALFFNQKMEFSADFLKPSKIKQISEDQITYAAGEDTVAKVIALKAPKITLQSLLHAKKKLVIETDLLVIDGGYIPKPKKWDIQAKEVKLINVNHNSQWINSLVQNGQINSSNFVGKQDPDCNFDIPPKKPIGQKIADIAGEIADLKNKFFPN